MNYNIRFFDMINCILLGTISIFIILFSLHITTDIVYIIFKNFIIIIDDTKNYINIYVIPIFLAIVYTFGLLINSIIDKISNRPYSVYEKLNPNKRTYKDFFSLSINRECARAKFYAKNFDEIDKDYPLWIFYSQNTNKVLSTLIERLSRVKNENVLNEYRYLNEFFHGLFYIFGLCTLYLLLYLFFNLLNTIFYNNYYIEYSLMYIQYFLNTIGNNQITQNISIIKEHRIFFTIFTSIVYIIFVCSCSKIAKFYAEKLIKYLSTCMEAHSMNINDIIVENGLPTVFILMKINRNVKREQIEKSLKSISKQGYQNIKVIMFIYGKQEYNAIKDDDFFKIIDVYKSDFIEFILYTREKYNKAESALEIRKIFIDTAQNNDVAIFLDPDDALDNKHVVSKIVKKFEVTTANLCLLNFIETENTEHSLIRDDKVIYDNMLSYLEKNEKSSKDIDNLQVHAAMTLNCVKAYKKDVLDFFVKQIQKFTDDQKSNASEKQYFFSQTGSYASFIDFFVFLYPELTVTALSSQSHKYIQHKNKHTKNYLKKFISDRISALEYFIQLSKYYIDTITSDNEKIRLTNTVLKYVAFKGYVITLLLDSFQFDLTEEDFIFFLKKIDINDIDKLQNDIDKLQNDIDKENASKFTVEMINNHVKFDKKAIFFNEIKEIINKNYKIPDNENSNENMIIYWLGASSCTSILEEIYNKTKGEIVNLKRLK